MPAQAIAQRDGKAVVFVVAEGKVKERAVAPAAQEVGGMKLVPQGVQAGEVLVLSPPETLRDGAPVKAKQ